MAGEGARDVSSFEDEGGGIDGERGRKEREEAYVNFVKGEMSREKGSIGGNSEQNAAARRGIGGGGETRGREPRDVQREGREGGDVRCTP